MKQTQDLHGDRPSAASAGGSADLQQLTSVAFERTRMPMVVVDARKPDLPIALANRAFLLLTGYSAEEVLGRNCRFLQGPGTSPIAVAEIRAAVAGEREVTVEILNYQKDERPFWNRLYLSPIHGDDGELLYFFGSQIDMTDYRRVEALEASEHRLLMEVDHRAKNVLALVDSIVRLSNADDPALYAAAIQSRVQALARAHTLLAERAWAGVGLRELVDQQVLPFAASQTVMTGPAIHVAASAVQPLALVFHELAVNAARHGALSTPAGALRIDWSVLASAPGFRLVWQEAGGGRVPVGKSGFGTVIMRALIERQLDGSFARSFTEDGMTVTMDVPVSP